MSPPLVLTNIFVDEIWVIEWDLGFEPCSKLWTICREVLHECPLSMSPLNAHFLINFSLSSFQGLGFMTSVQNTPSDGPCFGIKIRIFFGLKNL